MPKNYRRGRKSGQRTEEPASTAPAADATPAENITADDAASPVLPPTPPSTPASPPTRPSARVDGSPRGATADGEPAPVATSDEQSSSPPAARALSVAEDSKTGDGAKSSDDGDEVVVGGGDVEPEAEGGIVAPGNAEAVADAATHAEATRKAEEETAARTAAAEEKGAVLDEAEGLAEGEADPEAEGGIVGPGSAAAAADAQRHATELRAAEAAAAKPSVAESSPVEPLEPVNERLAAAGDVAHSPHIPKRRASRDMGASSEKHVTISPIVTADLTTSQAESRAQAEAAAKMDEGEALAEGEADPEGDAGVVGPGSAEAAAEAQRHAAELRAEEAGVVASPSDEPVVINEKLAAAGDEAHSPRVTKRSSSRERKHVTIAPDEATTSSAAATPVVPMHSADESVGATAKGWRRTEASDDTPAAPVRPDVLSSGRVWWCDAAIAIGVAAFVSRCL